MLNLLIISSSQAEHTGALWHSALLNLGNMLFSVVALICLFVGLMGTIAICGDNYSHKIMLFITIPMFLFSICIGIRGLYNTRAIRTNQGAVYNVIDYHKMAHLRKIYPKLPCNKLQLRYKTCHSNSLAKVSKDTRLTKHVMTRHQAVKKYNEIKAEYRSTSEAGNRSSSLHPRAPRWYNYI